MASSIRTPDDEIDRPGFFYPPFFQGWNYQGATYPGHSDFSVDFNRRTPAGGWLQDEGDPVYAAADGTVAEVDKRDGLVMLNHFAGGYRTEYRHMTNIPVKVGDKVQRGDRVGNIGNVAGDGRSFGAHLHHVHWRRHANDPWERIKMRFYDKPIATSVHDSDTRPEGWRPPMPVNVEGPPPKASWKSAFEEASQELSAAVKRVADLKLDLAGARGEVTGYRNQVSVLEADLATAESRIELLESGQNLDEVRRAARQSFKDDVEAIPA